MDEIICQKAKYYLQNERLNE